VLARTAGSAREPKRLTLFVVDAKAKGISRRDYPTQDALRASELTFDKVSVGADAVPAGRRGVPGRRRGGRSRHRGALRRGDEAVDAINAATLEYIKTRKQFGVPIGSSRCCSIAWSIASPMPRKRVR
jgi:alkylation response protein AidB-like acyl-CoA dehydrogenase